MFFKPNCCLCSLLICSVPMREWYPVALNCRFNKRGGYFNISIRLILEWDNYIEIHLIGYLTGGSKKRYRSARRFSIPLTNRTELLIAV